jgi:acylglycerol lipase
VNEYESPVESWTSLRKVTHGHRFVHTWAPEGTSPWGSVTIVHGFGDHGGRFAGLGNSLASMGLALLAVDLVGHGRSSGRRGCIDSYEQLLDEVELSLNWTEERWGRIPQFLFGQSMGGNLVINLALRRPESCHRLQGIIAGSPMLRAGKMPSEKFMNVGRWLAKKFPSLRFSAPVRTSQLSQDRRAQDAYRRDRFVHSRMSLRMATCLIDSGEWALQNATQLRTPTLIMHGTEDTLTMPSASEEFVRDAGDLASLQLWNGCRHDLHDDIRREIYFQALSNWMKQRCVSVFTLKIRRPSPSSSNIAA